MRSQSTTLRATGIRPQGYRRHSDMDRAAVRARAQGQDFAVTIRCLWGILRDVFLAGACNARSNFSSSRGHLPCVLLCDCECGRNQDQRSSALQHHFGGGDCPWRLRQITWVDKRQLPFKIVEHGLSERNLSRVAGWQRYGGYQDRATSAEAPAWHRVA